MVLVFYIRTVNMLSTRETAGGRGGGNGGNHFHLLVLFFPTLSSAFMSRSTINFIPMGTIFSSSSKCVICNNRVKNIKYIQERSR